jgi:ABC-type multidrug transport system permease subunit
VFHEWCNSFGQSIAALAPGPELASLIISLATTLMPALSGVPIPPEVIAPFWKWFYSINPNRWGAEIFIVNQFHELPIYCAPGEFRIFNPPPLTTCGVYLAPLQAAGSPGYLTNPQATSACEYCPISNGDAFISYQLGWAWSGLGLAFGVLGALFVFNRLTLIGFMKWRSGKNIAAGKT